MCYTAVLSILTCHSALISAISEDLFKKFIELLAMPLKMYPFNTVFYVTDSDNFSNGNFAPEVIEKTLIGVVKMFTCYLYNAPQGFLSYQLTFVVLTLLGKNIFAKGKETISSFVDALLDFLLFGDIFHPKVEQIASEAYYLAMIYDQVYLLFIINVHFRRIVLY